MFSLSLSFYSLPNPVVLDIPVDPPIIHQAVHRMSPQRALSRRHAVHASKIGPDVLEQN